MSPQTRSLFGLAGIIILAMSASLNEQVSSQGLGNILGGLGISHDPGTWFTTVYSAAEVVGMGMAPWLSVTFGMKRFVLIVALLTVLSSFPIPFIHNLTLLYGMRILQGVSGGCTIPLLMSIALKVLAPPIRLYGLAAYALTATCFPYLSTSLAGLWTDLVSWRFIFFQSIPLGAMAMALLNFGLTDTEPKLERLKERSFHLSTVLIIITMPAIVVLLAQGDRLDWFNSPLISVCALVAVVGLPLFVMNEIKRKEPFFRFSLLKRRNFLYSIVALQIFVMLSISSSAIPSQFLTAVAGYRPEQTYLVTAIIACLQLVFLPLMAIILNYEWVDSRIVSFLGLVCLISACCANSFVTAEWNRNQFYFWQAVQGLAGAMIVMPILMGATNAVMPQEGPYAAGMVNAPRAIMQVAGTWLVQLAFHWRGSLHSSRLTDWLGLHRYSLFQGNNPAWQHPAPLTPTGQTRTAGAVAALAKQLHHQVTVLVIEDLFMIIIMLAAFLLLWLLIVPVRAYPPRIALASPPPGPVTTPNTSDK
ncbi:MFS transporter [Aristophania vespae]|uniref:MFS transporter n=1 Tax=Aristophania vespae TaxID=2697033 RepID=UPI002351387F|nr:MFS transporter [Aristophania vespae]UMM63670.1 putative multidrug resistance protein EmrY [Aristophania vespae]